MRSFFCVVVAVLLFAASAAASPADSAAVKNRTAATARLAEAITFRTVSAVEEEKFAHSEFIKLHAYLQEAYPLVHQHLQREVINGYSLLYTWHGAQPQAKGVLLSAHMDVVPVEQASEQQWEQGPFAGVVEDGYIWGRGSMDDKYRVTAILEAVEQLLAQGYKPSRTVYLAFGHDEEVGGHAGAGMISEHLQQQGVQLEAVFDEGLAVAEGVMPGLTEPVALVGTAAKGNLDLRLTVQGDGGHSSVPPSDTPISILSHALHQLHQTPFEARMIPTTQETIAIMADKLGGKYSFAMRHYGLFKKRILKLLAKDRATDALIRTKLVPTVIEAGEKSNVLPTEATAIVNVRILNGENRQTVLQHVRKAINDDRVTIEQYGFYTPPSPVTRTDTRVYSALQNAIKNTYPEVMVVPALFPGATDSKHYTSLTDNIFRFAPQVVNREKAKLIHNVNERMAVDIYEKCIDFYKVLLHNTAGATGDKIVAGEKEQISTLGLNKY